MPKRRPSLDAAYMRVERGTTHLLELKHITEKIAEKWGAIELDRYLGDRFLEELRKRGPQPDVPPIIPILIGETAYNLRAALDYSVGQLSHLRTPIRPSDPVRRNQFPIEHSQTKFETRRKTFMAGLSEADIRLLQKFQPYKRCKWTAVLATLSNIDKHNHPNEVVQGFSLKKRAASSGETLVMELDPYVKVKVRSRMRAVRALTILTTQVLAFLDTIQPEFR